LIVEKSCEFGERRTRSSAIVFVHWLNEMEHEGEEERSSTSNMNPLFVDMDPDSLKRLQHSIGRDARKRSEQCSCQLKWCYEERISSRKEGGGVENRRAFVRAADSELNRQIVQMLRPLYKDKARYQFLWWHFKPRSFIWKDSFDRRSKRKRPDWFFDKSNMEACKEMRLAPPPGMHAVWVENRWISDEEKEKEYRTLKRQRMEFEEREKLVETKLGEVAKLREELANSKAKIQELEQELAHFRALSSPG